MKKPGPSTAYYGVIGLVSAMTLLGFVWSFQGVSWDNSPVVLALAALLFYLQSIVVKFEERLSYSLSTAVIFPIIYFAGTFWAMLVLGLLGLINGITDKKSVERSIFNASQLAFSGLLGSLAFRTASQSLDAVLGESAAMVLGISVYVLVNWFLVTFILSIWNRNRWWEQLETVGFGICAYSLVNGLIGIIFTYFIRSYGFWGVLAFGALLIYLAGLLQTAAAVSSERSRRRELEGELVVDEMTKAFNFRYLNQWLGEPTREDVAVLFLDVDNFKAFNDRFGHAEGDRVLKAMVQTINDSIRASDKVVRYGGDEFVILLFGMDKEGARRTAERIVENVNTSVLCPLEHSVTVSIGIAVSPHDTSDKRQLLLMSDQAMYAGKKSDTNSICLWEAEDLVV